MFSRYIDKDRCKYVFVYVYIYKYILPTLSAKKVWKIEIPVAVNKAYILASKYIFHSNKQ